MTPRQVKAKAEALLRKAHPDAVLTITWVQSPRRVTYPTGLKGIYGTMRVAAPGYRTRLMIADHDASGTMVRG